jgi:hypothetical protein
VTPAVLDRPASLFAERAAPDGRGVDGRGADGRAAAPGRLSGGRVTLEERLNAALHEALTNGSTECPVCHAGMMPTPTRTSPDANAVPGGAECGGCGSRLT